VAKDDKTRPAPISFRPGIVGAAIGRRLTGDLTEGQVVKRDLSRYYLLLSQALLDVRLTLDEARWLALADHEQRVEEERSGNPEKVDPSERLTATVKRAIAGFERQDERAPDVAYQVAAKVDAMTALQRAAVVDALDRRSLAVEFEVAKSFNESERA
jgi:hypothetical protein